MSTICLNKTYDKGMTLHSKRKSNLKSLMYLRISHNLCEMLIFLSRNRCWRSALEPRNNKSTNNNSIRKSEY